MFYCFLAPARPKTKPIPVHDATGKLLVTSTTIAIRMPICYYNDDHGPIKNVQVLVSETGGTSDFSLPCETLKCQFLNAKENYQNYQVKFTHNSDTI